MRLQTRQHWKIFLATGVACFLALQLSAQENEFIPVHSGTLLQNQSYCVDFDVKRRIPSWVYYHLEYLETETKYTRPKFRHDNRVVDCPRHEDYTNSGFDRGHLKPAADSKSSDQIFKNSFLMTNVVPQNPTMNQGIWKRVENQFRDWSMEFHGIHVITGTSPNSSRTMQNTDIAVPSFLWKAALRLQPDTMCIAFLVSNESINGRISEFLVSVDSLESLIGLDLFHQIPDNREQAIEHRLNNKEFGLQ